jgi:hypothetical protein
MIDKVQRIFAGRTGQISGSFSFETPELPPTASAFSMDRDSSISPLAFTLALQ